MTNVTKVDFPLFHDDRGDLNVIELKDYVDWDVKRVYYLTNVVLPRGGHCVKGENKIYVCMAGSVTAKFYDGNEWLEFDLQGPSQAVVMQGDYWREFDGFSKDCVLTVLSSLNYEKELYIMDIQEFEKYVSEKNN